MARTVDSPIKVPRISTGAGSEVVGDWQRSGVYYLARALNTCYEQLRRGPINDVNDGALINNTGQVAFYRCKAQGRGGVAGEQMQMKYHVSAAGGGSMTIRAKQGSNSTTWVYPGGTIDAIVDGGTMQVDDSSLYFDIEVDLSVLSGMSTSDVISILAWYEPARTELAATGSGDDAYDNNVIPLEVLRYLKECGFSTERIQDLHTMALNLITNRTGQICASAWPISYLTATSKVPYFLLQKPMLTTSDLNAVFWFRGTSDASKYVSIDIASGDLDTDGGWTGHDQQIDTGSDAWYGPLNVPIPNYPQLITARVNLESGVQLSSVCGWWDDWSE